MSRYPEEMQEYAARIVTEEERKRRQSRIYAGVILLLSSVTWIVQMARGFMLFDPWTAGGMVLNPILSIPTVIGAVVARPGSSQAGPGMLFVLLFWVGCVLWYGLLSLPALMWIRTDPKLKLSDGTPRVVWAVAQVGMLLGSWGFSMWLAIVMSWGD